ncbi:hypothetical protein STHAL_23780 [Streptomyces halstedii]|uniref:Uncharacterized protein n=1 Tax=Streptomyces halstedii TaxID=1944 RepID=A0ABS6TW51_STRHA|nr:hypothetical protein [Streptomyces halstedii]
MVLALVPGRTRCLRSRVLVGQGGSPTEILDDHAARLAPLTADDVDDLVTAPHRAPHRAARTCCPAVRAALPSASAHGSRGWSTAGYERFNWPVRNR